MPVSCESIPDDRQLVRYLVGLLPEEEAERLDEQSIVLDEVAARLSCVENDLVDAYVSGALEADILERFESFYLTSPQRCEKVKFAERFLAALERLRTPGAGLFCPAHPAVLGLVRDVIRAGARNSIGVSVCGEMAGDPLYTLLLLGLGLNIFSMNGPDVPEVKKIIRSTTVEHARQIARRVMSFDSERQVMHFLREETRKITPEAF